jgi:hypothetical protein
MMWTQVNMVRLQPGKAQELPGLLELLSSFEQPGSGLVRQLALQGAGDPSTAHVLVLFESEAQARAREGDPRRAAGLVEVRAAMAELLDGTPTFAEVNVVAEHVV